MDETLLRRHTAFNQLGSPHSRGPGAGEDDPEACQARVLEEWRRRATPLEAHVSNGRIHGTLVAFDRFMIALLTREGLQAIYKHAILAIVPAAAVSPGDGATKRPTLHLKRRADSESQ